MQIRFLKPDVAIIDGKWTIEGVHTPEGKDAPKELVVFSVVAVKQEDSWRISALREQSGAQSLRTFSPAAK